jgi:hypothetical protein
VIHLAWVIGCVAFLINLGSQALIQKDVHGGLVIDDMICKIFTGKVCGKMLKLTEDEQRTAMLLMNACKGGHLMEECMSQALTVYDVEPKEGVRLFTALCEGGEAAGCFNLGWMYRQGEGVAQDDQQAVALYRQACEGGYARGCTSLENMDAEGRGVPQDDKQTVE